MKLNFTDFLRKCQLYMLIALAGVPIPVLIAVFSLPEALGLVWITPVAFVLLSWCCLVIPGKKRIVAGLISAAALVALGVKTLPIEQSILLMIGPVVYSAALLWSLQIAGWKSDEEFHFGWYCSGVVTYGIVQVLINITKNTGKLLFATVETPMLICFLAYLFLALLSMNRGSMANASMGRQRIPALMRRRNRFLTIGFLALTVFLASLPAIIRAVEKAWDWLVDTIMKIVMFIISLRPDDSSGGATPGGSENITGGFEGGETSLLAEILEKIGFVLAFIMMAVALFFVLRALWKKLKILWQYILKRMNEFAASVSEDYEDEISDTRESGEKERIGVLEKMRRRMAFVDEKKLSPGERIRYRYQRLLYRHEDWHEGSTARENLPEAAASLYERARYSDHPVTDTDAESFSAGIKNV